MNLEFIFLNERIRIRIRISDSLFDSAQGHQEPSDIKTVQYPIYSKQWKVWLSLAFRIPNLVYGSKHIRLASPIKKSSASKY